MHLLSRLLLLLAVLLMPFGMTPALASASHSQVAAEMPMGHCPDQDHSAKGGMTECTMACAAALPATEVAVDDLIILGRDLVVSRSVHQLHGLHPETATPPPKRS